MKKLLALAIAALVALPLFAAEAFNGSAVHYLSANLPDDDPTTVTYWLMPLGDGADSSADYMVALGDGALINWASGRNSTPFFTVFGSGLTTGTGTTTSATQDAWFFLAIRRSGNTRQLYINGSTTAEASAQAGAGTAVSPGTRFAIGGFKSTGGSGNRSVCRIAAVKVWEAYLTPEEIANEMWGYRPRRTTNLYGWWPLWTYSATSADYSGGAHDLTAVVGTPTSADGPPIAW